MGSPVETTEEDFREGVELPSWALELGEKPVPLREAARLAGISLATAKRRIAERPALVLCRKGGSGRGRPAPFVLPSSLRPKEKAPDAKASSYFAHRCRLAGVNPSQALWRIVTGCLPDADKLIDAMRYAMDEKVERGTPLFLKWVCESPPLVYPKQRPALRHWLARFIVNGCSRRVPEQSFEKLWRMARRKVQREGKLNRHLLPQKVEGGKWRLAESPKYWEAKTLEKKPAFERMPSYAGERRLLDRQAKKLKAVEALGEMLLKSGSYSREVALVSKATKLMLKARPAPRFPAFEQARGRAINDGANLKERERLDFSGSVGGLASLGADARAEEALTLLMATGLSKNRAQTLLRAYWQRETKSFYSKPLSASAVRQIFGMSSRALTGKRPERRRKTHAPARKKNVSRSRLLSGKPSRKSAR